MYYKATRHVFGILNLHFSVPPALKEEEEEAPLIVRVYLKLGGRGNDPFSGRLLNCLLLSSSCIMRAKTTTHCPNAHHNILPSTKMGFKTASKYGTIEF